MLEERTYTKVEIVQILRTKSIEGIKRKLSRYDVEFDDSGRGDNLSITIRKIRNPFKVFCILDLGIPAQTDFKKLREFYYYFFCDEEFSAMPFEVKQRRLEEQGTNISRQTISNYERYLTENNLIAPSSSNCIYYFADKDKQRFCDEAEYKEAWADYWKHKDELLWSNICIALMKDKYGGVAKKRYVPEYNAIEADTINYLIDLVIDGMENDFTITF